MLAEWYDWLRALHLMAVISWMAGLFYLPRLFVYHAERGAPGSELSETLKTMERRLLRAIMTPAMIASWILGLLMMSALGLDFVAATLWLHVKIALALVMTAFHMELARWTKDFACDANRHSGRFYRLMNEAPTMLMIAIVTLAVVEPF